MDTNRSSSIYSTDPTDKTTYLDYRSSHRSNASSRKPSNVPSSATEYSDSVAAVPPTPAASSHENAGPSTYLTYRSSTASSSSVATGSAQSAESLPAAAPSTPRSGTRHTYSPSFMNYQNGKPALHARAKLIEVPHSRNISVATTVAADPAPPIGGGGLLLVFVPAEVRGEILTYIEQMLGKRRYAGMYVVGLEEHAAGMKQLKMDLYGLLGKLERETSLQVQLVNEWNLDAVQGAVKQAGVSGDAVRGVLCGIFFEGEGRDVLDLEESQVIEGWRKTFGLLRSVAKATVPGMVEGRRSDEGVFLIFEQDSSAPAAQANRQACRTLLRQVQESYGGRHLLVDLAENVLIAEPDRPVSRAAPHNGHADQEDDGFTPSESPTKLWNMWALHNEITG